VIRSSRRPVYPGGMLFRTCLLFVVALLLPTGTEAQSRKTLDWYYGGDELDAGTADKLEARLRKKPQDRSARIRLLGFYTRELPKTDPTAAARGRARHLLWLVENRPEDDVLGHAAALVESEGEPAGDHTLAQSLQDLWGEHVASSSVSVATLRHAAHFVGVDDPAQAARLYERIPPEEGSTTSTMGGLCARAVLGLVGFRRSDQRAARTDRSLTESDFAADCRRRALSSEDAEFISSFARAYYAQAGPAYASGVFQDDYTVFGAPLLGRARRMNGRPFNLMFVPAEQLPEHGKAWPSTLRIGGRVMQERLLHQVAPVYPEEARRQAVEGTVQITVAVGLEGRIHTLVVTDGPAALHQAAEEAVRQWRYKPTLLNGSPAYVVTRIDVSFTLR